MICPCLVHNMHIRKCNISANILLQAIIVRILRSRHNALTPSWFQVIYWIKRTFRLECLMDKYSNNRNKTHYVHTDLHYNHKNVPELELNPSGIRKKTIYTLSREETLFLFNRFITSYDLCLNFWVVIVCSDNSWAFGIQLTMLKTMIADLYTFI